VVALALRYEARRVSRHLLWPPGQETLVRSADSSRCDLRFLGSALDSTVVTRQVRLTPVDEQTLEPLLSVAVAETEPSEVMPPMPGPAGWSLARRDAFRDFHRGHFAGLEGPTRTVMYAIMMGSDVVGMIRMSRTDDPDTVETGMWLGQSARGQGIGVAALRALVAEAARAGARLLVANTTTGNVPALRALASCGAVIHRDGDAARAELKVGE
jgi:RimJ/RimL family protein N-acetyltransferase